MNGVLNFPSAYLDGHARAQAVDREAADNYVSHTVIGDPELDPMMEELASLRSAELHRFVGGCIEQSDEVALGAPRVLRDFFDNMETPSWVDHESFDPGIRAFHANAVDTITAFLCGVLVEGFTTLIRKSFVITGRVILEPTQRRQKQNIRQLIEIFLPGGLSRHGDGWKLSMRIRFIHARVRYLLQNSDDWYEEAWGTPISAAHLGYAIAVFSAGLMQYSARLGAAYTQEEKESVLAIWRYAGHVMGIPETILFADMESASKIRRIARICEPHCDADSALMANAWLQSAAATGGVTDPSECAALTDRAFRLSRALIGNNLADQMRFPKHRAFGTLFLYRLKRRIERLLQNEENSRHTTFSQFMNAAQFDERISYAMPDHAEHGLSKNW